MSASMMVPSESAVTEDAETEQTEQVTFTIANVAGRAETAVRRGQSVISEQAEVVSNQVEERPLLAVLIAAGIGYLLGRLLIP